MKRREFRRAAKKRPFHCLNDIAIRWSVMPLDVVGRPKVE
jgi:hypothetical protein